MTFTDQGKKYFNEQETSWSWQRTEFVKPLANASIAWRLSFIRYIMKCKNIQTSILDEKKIWKHLVPVWWKGKWKIWSNMYMTLRCAKPNDRKHSLLVLLKLLVSILAGCFHFNHYFCCYGLILGSFMRKSQMRKSQKRMSHSRYSLLQFSTWNINDHISGRLTLHSEHWKNWDPKYRFLTTYLALRSINIIYCGR